MAYFGPSNQLIQIDTGKVRTYLYNPTNSAAQIYAGLGESQALGQRYFGVDNTTPANPAGAPAIFVLVKYLATSATTTANLTTAGAPAPVYWTDGTFTTVTGIYSEGISVNTPAGYMMPNVVDIPGLTAAMLFGGMFLIQVAGYLKAAYGPTAGAAGIGNWINPLASTAFTTTGVAPGTAPGFQPFGVQLTAAVAGLADVLVKTDII